MRSEVSTFAAVRPDFTSSLGARPSHLAVQWRASPHRMVVNLVRSGRKQPQLFFASDGVRLATPIRREARDIGERRERIDVSPVRRATIHRQIRGPNITVTLALARKWRPRNFAELVGQDHVVRAISNALTQNRLHHAYSAHRHPRRGQDHAGAHHRQGAELRNRGYRDSLRQVRRLHRDRCRPPRGPDRARRRLQHPGGQHARIAGERALRADFRTLQGVHHRRSAHAVAQRVQCDAQDPRRTARPTSSSYSRPPIRRKSR